MAKEWPASVRKIKFSLNELAKRDNFGCVNCGTHEMLEKAHINHHPDEPYPIKGLNKPKKKRVYDTQYNDGSVALLCRKCHGIYDGRTGIGLDILLRNYMDLPEDLKLWVMREYNERESQVHAVRVKVWNYGETVKRIKLFTCIEEA